MAESFSAEGDSEIRLDLLGAFMQQHVQQARIKNPLPDTADKFVSTVFNGMPRYEDYNVRLTGCLPGGSPARVRWDNYSNSMFGRRSGRVHQGTWNTWIHHEFYDARQAHQVCGRGFDSRCDSKVRYNIYVTPNPNDNVVEMGEVRGAIYPNVHQFKFVIEGKDSRGATGAMKKASSGDVYSIVISRPDGGGTMEEVEVTLDGEGRGIHWFTPPEAGEYQFTIRHTTSGGSCITQPSFLASKSYPSGKRVVAFAYVSDIPEEETVDDGAETPEVQPTETLEETPDGATEEPPSGGDGINWPMVLGIGAVGLLFGVLA